MPDYEKLYFMLYNAVNEAIESLETVMRETNLAHLRDGREYDEKLEQEIERMHKHFGTSKDDEY